MVTFKKTQDAEMSICYNVSIDDEYVDLIGKAHDPDYWGEGWINLSSEVADIIGGGFDFQSIKKAFVDNEQEIKRIILN